MVVDADLISPLLSILRDRHDHVVLDNEVRHNALEALTCIIQRGSVVQIIIQ